MNKTIEQRLFESVHELEGTELSAIGIHDNSDYSNQESYRVYHADGYCFDVSKDYICEPDELNEHDVEGLQQDGCVYSFYSSHDGFKDLSEKEAFELMENVEQ